MTLLYADMQLPDALKSTLARMQFVTPTPIQEQAIPVALEGRDVLGTAQTGTGKTAAFTVPLVARLLEDKNATALIMCPTRELATQVSKVVVELLGFKSYIKTALLIGGDSMGKQLMQLKAKPRVIIGTPGRINDHLDRTTLRLDQTKIVVLDEADRMLDMGFGIQIDAILGHVPADRQTMLFSATLPREILNLVKNYQTDPVRISVGEANAAATKVEQSSVFLTAGEKYGELLKQLEQREGSVIIFVKTKFGADRLATRLAEDNHRVDAIHGDLQQRKRERVIQAFRDKRHRILVATDVAARGLDIPHIEHVINFDLPQNPEDYIHRIGRTARANSKGSAVSFVSRDENRKWRAITEMLDPASAKQEGTRVSAARTGKPFVKAGAKSNPFADKYGAKKKPYGEKATAPKERKPFAERSNEAYEPARSTAPRPWRDASADKPAKSASEGYSKKAYTPREDRFEQRAEKPKSFDKPYGKKPFVEKKAFGDKKPFGEKKPYGDKKSFGEKKPFGDRKPYGDKKGFGKPVDRPWLNDGTSPEQRGERPAARDFSERKQKDSGERKPFGRTAEQRAERPARGVRAPRAERAANYERAERGANVERAERPASFERAPREYKPREEGAREFTKKPFGDKKFGDKKSFGDKKPYESKSFGDRPYVKKPFGEKKAFSEKKADFAEESRPDYDTSRKAYNQLLSKSSGRAVSPNAGKPAGKKSFSKRPK